jgi:hypothetical protein
MQLRVLFNFVNTVSKGKVNSKKFELNILNPETSTSLQNSFPCQDSLKTRHPSRRVRWTRHTVGMQSLCVNLLIRCEGVGLILPLRKGGAHCSELTFLFLKSRGFYDGLGEY